MTSALDRLRQLREQKGNTACADCREKKPEWCCLNRGVFLCITCAGIHRRLRSSKVRSCRLDTWNDNMVDSITEKGNLKGKAKWEANVPPCWVPPAPHSRYICKEQWIYAKYNREEFLSTVNDSRRVYMSGIKQGILYKRMKQSEVWNSRWFVLAEGNLTYFKSYRERSPKSIIPLTHLNVLMNGPGMESHPNAMMLTFWEDKSRKTRHIFVYAELAKDIMDWFCAIRTAKISVTRRMIPERTLQETSHSATWEFTMWGYLCKMPPTQKKFQKRFFILDKNSLRYYQTPYDPFPLGEISLGPSMNGFWVDEKVPPKLQHYTNIFMLHTPSRSNGGFPLLAEDSSSKATWIRALQDTIRSYKGSRLAERVLHHDTPRAHSEAEEEEEEHTVEHTVV